ncbi:MAG: DEAD/DEAH box helicase family protein, partial [Clostridia bacterium]|nr:DEAD/DEAH box helicase family protein [Clostridia bacterium]
MKLYAWQQECLTAWEAHHFRGIVHVATGAGKTVLALN